MLKIYLSKNIFCKYENNLFYFDFRCYESLDEDTNPNFYQTYSSDDTDSEDTVSNFSLSSSDLDFLSVEQTD